MAIMSVADGRSENRDDCIVLYPYPAMGHLISMVELGKRFIDLVNTNGGAFTVLVIVAEAPFVLPNIDVYIKTVAETHPSIVFLRLPPLPSFSAGDYYPPRNRTVEIAFEFVRAANPSLGVALRAVSLFACVRGLFVDFFSYAAMDVAYEVGIPEYLFMASPAAQLAMFLYLPTMHRDMGEVSFKDMERGSVMEFPGLPPLPPADIPQGLEDRNEKSYGEFLELGKRIAKAAGFVVNSFDSLEPLAVEALAEDGVCVPGGRTPPCYVVGPLIAPDKGDRAAGYYLKWLDSQPRRSVVFLSFGSMVGFAAEQVTEIAAGLERSGHAFLWVLRCSDEDDAGGVDGGLLPEGFLERTRGRGLVWKSWAEQAAVLGRDSVGAFVTHCGWNSVLESVCAGVPMVAWPLYAEQRMIRTLVTEEMKLGVAVEFNDEGRTPPVVTAVEVEKRVREVMESEEGRAMRERAEAMKANAAAALREGGPSHAALLDLAKTLKQY